MKEFSKIGIFDSGIGGVTVLREMIKIMPNEKYIYYSDSKNNPYGDKTDIEIINICDKIIKFLSDEGCKIIVIACNTASAKAASFLRNKYKDKIIVAIEPAYKMVNDYAKENETLIMATKGTLESNKFKLLYNKYNNNKTYLCACVGLADIIEENNDEKIIKYLEENIGKYKNKVKNVVLGCTHYPLIKEQIKRILGEVVFFDGAPGIAMHLKSIIEETENTSNTKGYVRFIDSQGLEEKKERFFKILEAKVN